MHSRLPNYPLKNNSIFCFYWWVAFQYDLLCPRRRASRKIRKPLGSRFRGNDQGQSNSYYMIDMIQGCSKTQSILFRPKKCTWPEDSQFTIVRPSGESAQLKIGLSPEKVVTAWPPLRPGVCGSLTVQPFNQQLLFFKKARALLRFYYRL